VAKDGQRIAGRNASGEAVVFDRETQKVDAIPGVEQQESLQKWTEDGQALLVSSGTPWEARMYRVEVATGQRTLLQKVELSERAGSIMPMRLAYAEGSKTVHCRKHTARTTAAIISVAVSPTLGTEFGPTVECHLRSIIRCTRSKRRPGLCGCLRADVSHTRFASSNKST
jgi:hypothetical protein